MAEEVSMENVEQTEAMEAETPADAEATEQVNGDEVAETTVSFNLRK